MSQMPCPHCGVTVRQGRPDGRCVGCGKPLPEGLRAAPEPAVQAPASAQGGTRRGKAPVPWWRRLLGLGPAPGARLKARRVTTEEASSGGRVDAAGLDAYLRAIEGVFRDYFDSIAPGPGQDVLLRGTLKPGEKVAELPIILPVEGFLDPDLLGPLYGQLFALPVPEVRDGPVEFFMVFALWGGSAGRPFGV
jgi:hypothetical protein